MQILDEIKTHIAASTVLEKYTLGLHDSEDPELLHSLTTQAFEKKRAKMINEQKTISIGIHFHWQCDLGINNFTFGEFNLFNLKHAFLYNDCSFIETLPADPYYLCYIDNRPDTADNTYTLAGWAKNSRNIELAYWNNHNILSLKLTPFEYQKMAIQFLGYSNWQTYFSKVLSDEEKYYLREKHLPEMKRDLMGVFQSIDINAFTILDNLVA